MDNSLGGTLYVAIGGLCRGRPVPDFEEFQRAVFVAVEAAARGFYFRGTGQGYSNNWGSEPAYVLVTPLPDPERLELYKHRLSVLASEWGQEAIVVATFDATTVGPTSKVGPIRKVGTEVKVAHKAGAK